MRRILNDNVYNLTTCVILFAFVLYLAGKLLLALNRVAGHNPSPRVVLFCALVPTIFMIYSGSLIREIREEFVSLYGRF